jgi:hypothetical protein
VHAIVSTLVTVANTSANAVPVSSSNEPAVEAYQDFCLGTSPTRESTVRFKPFRPESAS